ncbi:MAG TPA: hypothetical protein PLD54_01145 [Candidatus Levybacteria bacterium]|nr:hypothetical protein [Candidatus Levybacteria bacterium]
MKRLLVALVFVSLFFHTFTPFASAQTVSPSPAPLSTRLNDDVPRDYSTHTQMLIIEVLAAVSCQLSGVDPINPSGKCLGVDPQTNKIGFVENGGGAIAVVTKMMIFTFDIPISTHDYASYAVSDFGIAKNTYAQNASAGFSSLSPLLPAWAAFRNVVYVLFVIAFMLVGMGIMFRRNMDPKTVMTIQNSIPRVIIVLLLVTFSFAISGFLIDLMYLSMYLLYGVVDSIEGVNIAVLSPTSIVGSTPFGAIGGFGGMGLAAEASRGLGSQISAIFDGGVGNAVGGIIVAIMTLPLLLIPGVNLAVGLGIGAGALGLGSVVGFGGIGNEVIGVIGGMIAFLIITIAILSALFRLWIALIKSYLFILIDVAIAPIWIAGSLIPGSPWTMGSWFRHILKYVLVFPLTFAMFLLGTAIIQLFNAIPDDASIFAPPFIGNSLNPKHLGSLLGLGLILMLPEVINMIQSIIKAPENQFQKAIPQGFGIATGVVSKATSPLAKAGWAHDKAGNAEGFVNRRIWASLNNRARERAKQGKSGGVAGFIANRMTGPDRGAREAREDEFERLRRESTMENIIQYDQRTNRLVPPTISSDHTEGDVNAMTSRHQESATASQERLNRYRQSIQSIVTRLNNRERVSENEETFEGLADSLQSDVLFAAQLQQTQRANPQANQTDLLRIAREEFARQFPVLLHRYDLRDRVRLRNNPI